MTDKEKSQIVTLQKEGMGYKKIAATLGLPINGVKTFCRRHPVDLKEETVSPDVCLYCRTALHQTPHKRFKKFCSDVCRRAWWSAHPEQVNKKAYRSYICPQCGQQFESYGNKPRVYCSRACYALARRKEVLANE